MTSSRLRLVAIAAAGSLISLAPGRAQITAPQGSIWNPADAPSLGTLAPVSGTVAFDTAAGTFSINGGTPMGGGVDAHSQSGNVTLMAFAFDSISLPAGVTVTVTGDKGLALLSTGGISIGTSISLAGGEWAD